MTKAKPFNPIKPTTEKPWFYDPRGQYIWMGEPSDAKMIADVRGWGWLQYLPNGEKLQDVNGELIAEAGTVHHETGMSPRELTYLVQRLSFALRGMMDVYGTICDTQNWDRHHMAQYTTGEELLKKLERFKVTA